VVKMGIDEKSIYRLAFYFVNNYTLPEIKETFELDEGDDDERIPVGKMPNEKIEQGIIYFQTKKGQKTLEEIIKRGNVIQINNPKYILTKLVVQQYQAIIKKRYVPSKHKNLITEDLKLGLKNKEIHNNRIYGNDFEYFIEKESKYEFGTISYEGNIITSLAISPQKRKTKTTPNKRRHRRKKEAILINSSGKENNFEDIIKEIYS